MRNENPWQHVLLMFMHTNQPIGHIFYDEQGGTIAFNSNGSVFCNFRFYNQLHAPKMESSPVEGRVDAASYWWIVIAHELAHNLVKEHNAEHSFYTYVLTFVSILDCQLIWI